MVTTSYFVLGALYFVLCVLYFVLGATRISVLKISDLSVQPTKSAGQRIKANKKTLSTKHKVPSTKYKVQSTEYKIPSTKYKAPSTKCYPLAPQPGPSIIRADTFRKLAVRAHEKGIRTRA